MTQALTPELLERIRNAKSVCAKCGNDYGRGRTGILVSTWHLGTCDICGMAREITEFRDYGYDHPRYQKQ